jgi:hypothetical protein
MGTNKMSGFVSARRIIQLVQSPFYLIFFGLFIDFPFDDDCVDLLLHLCPCQNYYKRFVSSTDVWFQIFLKYAGEGRSIILVGDLRIWYAYRCYI